MYYRTRKIVLRVYQTIFRTYTFKGAARGVAPLDRYNSALAGRKLMWKPAKYKYKDAGVDSDVLFGPMDWG